jgi:hypothetical protein
MKISMLLAFDNRVKNTESREAGTVTVSDSAVLVRLFYFRFDNDWAQTFGFDNREKNTELREDEFFLLRIG